MLELLRKRRSIRQYKSDPVKPEHLEILKEALLRSPSSRNKRPWTFIFVDDKALIDQLSRSKAHGSQFLKGAPLAVVICGDSEVTDVWVEDCSIASIILQLQGEDLGIGSCWIQIRNRLHNNDMSAQAYIQKLLNIPERLAVESIIGMGYPDEEKQPVPESELPSEKIKYNQCD
ncbi:MAG: nitroreductase family protein [Fidelibacterota bacterium]